MQFHLPGFYPMDILRWVCRFHCDFVYYSKDGNELKCPSKRQLQACLILLCRYYIFYKSKVCGSPALSRSISAIFPTAFAHFVSWCHILVILSVFRTFPLLLYWLWWSVVRDLWCYCCNCFGVNFVDKCLWLLHQLTGSSSIFHLLLRFLSPESNHSLRHNKMEVRPLNNPTVASRCSSERTSCLALTFDQKLEVIKFSEEGTWKAETGCKRGLLC